MFKEGGNFLQSHIEKIVMGVVGLACLYILFMRVIISPNYVVYENKKFSPTDIDDYIRKQAVAMQDTTEDEPVQSKPYKNEYKDFMVFFDSPLAKFTEMKLAVSQNVGRMDSDAKYAVPEIGIIRDAQAEHLRAVAYYPKQEITADLTYDKSETEPNDLDLITVEAKLDVAGIYKNFYKAYAGDSIKPEWRDPCLAVPIFAAVELQRQQLKSDGQWGDWQSVPRIKIDYMRSMLEVIENVEDLPRGGMKVRLLQFNRPDVRENLLQPSVYSIASSQETWLPPALHRKFLKIQADEKAAERRDAATREREERERAADAQRRESGRTSPQPGGATSPSPARDRTTRTPERSSPTRDVRRSEPQPARTREAPPKETTSSIFDEFEQMRISAITDLSQMKGDLLVWAHDDTAQPGKTYRYRIRAGVFNSLAGTDSFLEGHEKFKNQTILWSSFSETEAVEIPARLYFFPTEMQETVNAVKVEVAKYEMGYWYSSEFLVKQGETIGGPKERKATDDEKQKGITVPSVIDYTSGAVMVDAVNAEDWEGTKSLKSRRYSDMYYSYDGIIMENLPVRQANWPSDLKNRYSEIRNLLRQPKEPLLPFGSQSTGRQSAPGRRQGSEMWEEIILR